LLRHLWASPSVSLDKKYDVDNFLSVYYEKYKNANRLDSDDEKFKKGNEVFILIFLRYFFHVLNYSHLDLNRGA